jgi:hypothetical protein
LIDRQKKLDIEPLVTSQLPVGISRFEARDRLGRYGDIRYSPSRAGLPARLLQPGDQAAFSVSSPNGQIGNTGVQVYVPM